MDTLLIKQKILSLLVLFVIITLLNVSFPFSKIVLAQTNFTYYNNPLSRTSIKYPLDWLHLYNGHSTVFLSPATNISRTGAARILVENPIDTSNIDPNTLSAVLKDYYMQKKDLTELAQPASFTSQTGLQYSTLTYSYNDPIFGITQVSDVYIRNGDMLSLIEYQTDHHSFNLNFPVFMDMVASYNIPSTSGEPIGLNPVCDTDPSFICGLPEGSTVSPSVAHLFGNLINLGG